MSPIQQMLLGVGAVATKTYMDDVFSTYLYDGTSVSNSGPAQTINNGIDVSGKGGLVWIKTRNGGLSHALFDTVRGKTKRIKTNSSDGENTSTSYLADFKTNGFEVGTSASTNSSDGIFASFTFAKQKGFFDVVEYTAANISNQRVSHSLGCIPGLILLKNKSRSDEPWYVYHRSLETTQYLHLNTSAATTTEGSTIWDATSTDFGVATSTICYGAAGSTYIAYVFAGGESTAATATSVDFTNTGSGQGQVRASTSGGALEFGTGDFTIECWVKPTNLGSNLEVLFDSGNNGGNASDSVYFGFNQSEVFLKSENAYYNQASTTNYDDQWMHVAACRSGTNLRIFKNGILLKTTTNSTDLKSGSNLFIIGKAGNITGDLTGSISNFRAIKGQALYTSSFRPSTEPLTTTSQGATASNVKLLCCQGSTPSAATVSPYTLSAYYATASSDSPFDDPAGFVLGENKDENVIKCGKYSGNETTSNHIFLGWEPQWVMIKRATGTAGWYMFDNMRGVSTGGNDGRLEANDSASANTSTSVIDFTSTGFELTTTSSYYNKGSDNSEYIYMAIRRPDGYVGKPPELGTDVFAMDTGNGSSTIPAFDSGFVVDMAIARRPAITDDWREFDRLRGSRYLEPNNSDQHTSPSTWVHWDSNVGVGTDFTSSYQSWMWKRHAGFDVVCYEGTGSTQVLSHSLGKNVEMAWIKRRDGTADWKVYHSGTDSSNPEDYNLTLNGTGARDYSTTRFGAPSSTHFTVNTHATTNGSGNSYLMMLFASVDGISKVGSFSGSNSDLSVNVGFQPRFLIMKGYTGSNAGYHWFVFDSLRGFSSGNDSKLHLSTDGAENNEYNTGTFTSTGFTLTGNTIQNISGTSFIYYCHA